MDICGYLWLFFNLSCFVHRQRYSVSVPLVGVGYQVVTSAPLSCGSRATRGRERERTTTAMFVVLTTTEHGRFRDNAMLIEAGAPRQIVFVQWGAVNITALKRSLRVEHLVDNLAHVAQ